MQRRMLWLVVTATFVLAACTSNPAHPASPPAGSPKPSATAAVLPGGSGAIDRTALSGRIVFDNYRDVWSINAAGTGLTRLTRASGPDAHDFDATLSPDGKQIAYRRERNGGAPEVWVMHADGSGQHRLTRDGGFPTWSPDGSMIAYAPPGGPSGRSWIAIMNADGSRQRRLPHTDGGEYPSWSPDGKRIAFSSNLSGGARMSIVDVDGSRVVDLSGVGEGGQVAWSPDGRSILFASHRDHPDNYRDIYVMRPDGSGVHRLTRGWRGNAGVVSGRPLCRLLRPRRAGGDAGGWFRRQRAPGRGRGGGGFSGLAVAMGPVRKRTRWSQGLGNVPGVSVHGLANG